MESNTMKKHVSLVAALQIGFSTMGIIGATILYFVFAFAGSFVPHGNIESTVLSFIGTFLPTLIIFVAIFGLIGGIGLLRYQKWAKVLVMIISAVGCFVFPIGTIIGVYSLWVLMQDETSSMFV